MIVPYKKGDLIVLEPGWYPAKDVRSSDTIEKFETELLAIVFSVERSGECYIGRLPPYLTVMIMHRDCRSARISYVQDVKRLLSVPKF